jgi:hypothetical protein
MSKWIISPAVKKNIEENSMWTKNGQTICRIEWYRWGSWSMESDQRPDVDLDNPDGYDVYGSDYDWELVDMTDGVSAEWEFPDDMDAAEQTRIEELYDEEGYSGLEEDGWDNSETEVFIHGLLELTVETD